MTGIELIRYTPSLLVFDWLTSWLGKGAEAVGDTVLKPIRDMIASLLRGLGELLMNCGEKFIQMGYDFWKWASGAVLKYSVMNPQAMASWSTVRGLLDAFVAVGVSLAVLYFVLGWVHESIDIRTTFTMENLIRMFVRFVITIALVTNSAQLAVDISQIAVSLTGAASAMISSQLTMEEPTFLKDYREYLSDQWDSAGKPKKKSDGRKKTGSGEESGKDESVSRWTLALNYLGGGFLSLIAGIFGGAIIVISGINIVLAVFTRLFKVLLAVPFAPIALAGFAGGGAYSQTGISWLKTYIGYCLEAFLIVLAIGLSFTLFHNADFLPASEDSKPLMGTLAYVMPILATSACVKGAEGIMSKMLGI